MKRVILMVFLFFLLSACASSNLTSEEEPLDVNPESTLVPYASSAVDASYPTNSPVPTFVYVFRESKPGTVTIHGDLLAMDPDNLPAPDDAIFLVSIPEDVQVSSIPPIMFGETPQADVFESTGEFVFTDVEPGLYAIVVLTISNAQIPARMDDGSFAIIRVENADRDKTIELGSVHIP